MTLTWKNSLFYIMLLLLVASCTEDSAKGKSTSKLKMEATIFALSDNRLSGPSLAEDVEITVRLTLGNFGDSIRLENGGTIVAHVNGVEHELEEIEIAPIPPYSYDSKYYYRITLSEMSAQAEIRIAINRPSKTSALYSIVTLPTKPANFVPTDNTTLFRAQDVYTSWLQEDANDTISINLAACILSDHIFTMNDTGEFTITSDTFMPHDAACDGTISIRRIREGTPDSTLGQSSITATRKSINRITVEP